MSLWSKNLYCCLLQGPISLSRKKCVPKGLWSNPFLFGCSHQTHFRSKSLCSLIENKIWAQDYWQSRTQNICDQTQLRSNLLRSDSNALEFFMIIPKCAWSRLWQHEMRLKTVLARHKEKNLISKEIDRSMILIRNISFSLAINFYICRKLLFALICSTMEALIRMALLRKTKHSCWEKKICINLWLIFDPTHDLIQF